MFGFRNVFGSDPEFFRFFHDFFGEIEEAKLAGARLLNDENFTINGIEYNQKVYLLVDHSVYTVTKQTNESAELQNALKKAIKNEEYEEAAKLRDQIKNLK